MKSESFYPQIEKLYAEPPQARHAAMTQLHVQGLREYTAWIEKITPAAAAAASSDGRPISLVVGHIAEWDRWLIQAAGEMLSGVAWPTIMKIKGYRDADGESHDFQSVDAFNAFHAGRQADVPWPAMQRLALDLAHVAHALFTQPALLTAERLEATRAYKWKMPGVGRLSAPTGWYLWFVTIEHEAVEHASDLENAARQG